MLHPILKMEALPFELRKRVNRFYAKLENLRFSTLDSAGILYRAGDLGILTPPAEMPDTKLSVRFVPTLAALVTTLPHFDGGNLDSARWPA